MKSIFIGTLFNGESEFFEHSKAIVSQDKVNYTHHVIRNLPEHEAHRQLWLDWESNQNKFDFMKIHVISISLWLDHLISHDNTNDHTKETKS
jgi:hypothetical protein